MTKTLVATYNVTREYRVYINKMLMMGCLFAALLYAFNMYTIVTRTVTAQKLESQTAKLSSEVQNLDAKYIELSNKITPEMAKEFGLHESNVADYIPRTRSLGSAGVAIREL